MDLQQHLFLTGRVQFINHHLQSSFQTAVLLCVNVLSNIFRYLCDLQMQQGLLRSREAGGVSRLAFGSWEEVSTYMWSGWVVVGPGNNLLRAVARDQVDLFMSHLNKPVQKKDRPNQIMRLDHGFLNMFTYQW